MTEANDLAVRNIMTSSCQTDAGRSQEAFPPARDTMSRRHQRIHDKANYLRNRFFDGNPDAKAEYITHKIQRNQNWAAMDEMMTVAREGALSESDPISGDASRRSTIQKANSAPRDTGAERQRDKLRRFGDPPAGKANSTVAQSETPSPERPGKRHGLPLLVRAVDALKRRNRKRSDVKPGYFEPGRQYALPRQAGASADRLEMNIPTDATPISRTRGSAENKESDDRWM